MYPLRLWLISLSIFTGKLRRVIPVEGHKKVTDDITVVLLSENDGTGRTMLLEDAGELDSSSDLVAVAWFTQ